MTAFKRFTPGDLIDNVLVLEPKYDLASGSAGWHGSPEGSASLTLYGAERRAPNGIFSRIQYKSIYPGANLDPTLTMPLTASVRSIVMRNGDLTETDTSWGLRHWAAVDRLYQDYAWLDPDYVSGTYDNFCLYFNRDSRNILSIQGPLAAVDERFPSASFLIESWVKPFQTSSLFQDFTIASLNRSFWVGITGSTGRLTFSSSLGAFTASAGPEIDRWSHVAVSYDAATLTASIRINAKDVGSFGHPNLIRSNSFSASFTVGARFSGPVAANREQWESAGAATWTPFHGLIGETRLWDVRRTDAQLSSSMSSRLPMSEMTGTVYCFSMNEGPTLDFGPADTIAFFNLPSAGSGVLNGPRVGQVYDGNSVEFQSAFGTRTFGFLIGFDDRPGPVWLPNDNQRFTTDKVIVGSRPPVSWLESQRLFYEDQADADPAGNVLHYNPTNMRLVITIPPAFSGRGIAPESVVLTCRAFSSGSHGLVRTLIDDGRGNLFVSGSMSSGTLGSREDYRGVEWNKVGNVFYGEGLIVIKDPTLFDFGRDDGASAHPNDTLQLTFRGQSRVPVKTLMCRVDHGEFNASINPTFWTTGSAGERIRTHPSGSIWATTIGLYNSNRELVGIARFAEPKRIRPRDRLNFRLRMDF